MRGVLGTWTLSGWVTRTAGGGTIAEGRAVRVGLAIGGGSGLGVSDLETGCGLALGSPVAVGRAGAASHWLRWVRKLWTSVALTAICWRSTAVMRSNLIGVCWEAA